MIFKTRAMLSRIATRIIIPITALFDHFSGIMILVAVQCWPNLLVSVENGYTSIQGMESA